MSCVHILKMQAWHDSVMSHVLSQFIHRSSMFLYWENDTILHVQLNPVSLQIRLYYVEENAYKPSKALCPESGWGRKNCCLKTVRWHDNRKQHSMQWKLQQNVVWRKQTINPRLRTSISSIKPGMREFSCMSVCHNKNIYSYIHMAYYTTLKCNDT